MSRLGKIPLAVPQGVKINASGADVHVEGPKGKLSLSLVSGIELEQGDRGVTVMRRDDSRQQRAAQGLMRSLVSNMLVGVSEGFSKTLEITGVGYRAAMQGKTLNLQLGYSHDINYPIPEGIEIKCENQTTIEVSGADKQAVGQVAAEIRAFRKPEPYKGKGIRYRGEQILRKEGKKK